MVELPRSAWWTDSTNERTALMLCVHAATACFNDGVVVSGCCYTCVFRTRTVGSTHVLPLAVLPDFTQAFSAYVLWEARETLMA